ncbi:MAG: transcriptional regulator, partial [Haemophilus parainfluenzae]|nr:transcriptional regulator [Haemophilus parainfluenzae]
MEKNLNRGNVLASACPSRQILQHLTSRWGALVLVSL